MQIEIAVTFDPVCAAVLNFLFGRNAANLRGQRVWVPSAALWHKEAADHRFLTEMNDAELVHFARTMLRAADEQNPDGRTVLLVNLDEPSLDRKARNITDLRQLLLTEARCPVLISTFSVSPSERIRTKYSGALLDGEVRPVSRLVPGDTQFPPMPGISTRVTDAADRVYVVSETAALAAFWRNEYGPALPVGAEILNSELDFILSADRWDWEAKRISNSLGMHGISSGFHQIQRMVISLDRALFAPFRFDLPESLSPSDERLQLIGSGSTSIESVTLSVDGWRILSTMLQLRSALTAPSPDVSREPAPR